MSFLRFQRQTTASIFAASLLLMPLKVRWQQRSSKGEVISSNNAVADLSISDGNPNGNWSYGYTDLLGSAFKKYLVTDAASIAGMIHWGAAPGWPRNAASNPSIDRNVTANTISPLAGIIVPNNVLHMHPGPNGQYSVLRWTAPDTGFYTIVGFFEGLNSHPTSTDVHILLNENNALFGGDILTFMMPSNFNINRPLAAGDTIDFAVGFGTDGNYFFDSTGLSARILLRKSKN